jgi:hypothetical protein
LHAQRLHDRGRKHIEWDDISRQVRRWNLCAIQRRRRIPLTETADVDELVGDQGDARDATQGRANGRVAKALNRLRIHQVRNRRVRNAFVNDLLAGTDKATGNHNFLDTAKIGIRCGDDRFRWCDGGIGSLLPLFLLGMGATRRADGASQHPRQQIPDCSVDLFHV